MFETTIAGSLPKPSWLAEPHKLWPQWKLSGEALAEAKRDATLVWLKHRKTPDRHRQRRRAVAAALRARISRIGGGSRFPAQGEDGHSRQSLRGHGAGVVGAVRLRGRVHETEAQVARAHTTRKLKITMPGPMTMVDTVADSHYRDKAKLAMALAELLNQEAHALEAQGVDVIQFDEPAFNVYMDDVKRWGSRHCTGRSRA